MSLVTCLIASKVLRNSVGQKTVSECSRNIWENMWPRRSKLFGLRNGYAIKTGKFEVIQ